MDGWLEHLAREGDGPAHRPDQVEALLADPVPRASPFLVFALAVHRTATGLEAVSFHPEWNGRRRRVAVFDAPALREFLATPTRQLFLAELLASEVHVGSGSVGYGSPAAGGGATASSTRSA